jgi:hypothetical protein
MTKILSTAEEIENIQLPTNDDGSIKWTEIKFDPGTPNGLLYNTNRPFYTFGDVKICPTAFPIMVARAIKEQAAKEAEKFLLASNVAIGLRIMKI